jgi:hypothetical protein
MCCLKAYMDWAITPGLKRGRSASSKRKQHQQQQQQQTGRRSPSGGDSSKAKPDVWAILK